MSPLPEGGSPPFRLNDEGLVARFTRTVKPSPEQDTYVQHVHLARFSFLILIGRFVTFDP
jgi:hypothetical protein